MAKIDESSLCGWSFCVHQCDPPGPPNLEKRYPPWIRLTFHSVRFKLMMRKPIACYFYVKNVFFSATCIGNESHGNDMSSMYFIYILKHE